MSRPSRIIDLHDIAVSELAEAIVAVSSHEYDRALLLIRDAEHYTSPRRGPKTKEPPGGGSVRGQALKP